MSHPNIKTPMKNARFAPPKHKPQRVLTVMDKWFLSAARNRNGRIPTVTEYNHSIATHKYVGCKIDL